MGTWDPPRNAATFDKKNEEKKNQRPELTGSEDWVVQLALHDAAVSPPKGVPYEGEESKPAKRASLGNT